MKSPFHKPKTNPKGAPPRALAALAAALAALTLASCAFTEGAVTRPEFTQLSGRVTTLEDIVIDRRASGAGAGPPLPPGAPGALPAPGSVHGALPAPGSAPGGLAPPAAAPGRAAASEKSRYNKALSLLRAKRYADSEAAFRSFLTDFPGGALAPNARYWLGETMYARGDFQGARGEFQRGASEFPNSAKAPDCLLKLAYSQSKLGDGAGAMESVRALLERYPSSNSAKMVLNGTARFPK
jgi:tol-pal system protein YbgF